MEKFPSKKSTYESPLGSFEVDEFTALQPGDIGPGDRAFVHTKSGNRYMLRHSKSRGGELVIYNEREGFDAEHARPFRIRQGSNAIATVGAPLNYFAIMNEKEQTGGEVASTEVTRIEVRRGLDEAANAADKGSEGLGSIADALKEAVRGRRRIGPDSSE
jgi:hypothetical protein